MDQFGCVIFFPLVQTRMDDYETELKQQVLLLLLRQEHEEIGRSKFTWLAPYHTNLMS